jgi:hypothetical protein
MCSEQAASVPLLVGSIDAMNGGHEVCAPSVVADGRFADARGLSILLDARVGTA